MLNRNFRFCPIIYDMASLVHDTAREPSSFYEVNWKDQVVVSWLCKFSKITLLHHYINRTICIYYSRDYRKNSDFYIDFEPGEGYLAIAEIENAFRLYDVEVMPFNKFCLQKYNVEFSLKGFCDRIQDEWFYSWFLDQWEYFNELWERITDEVFHLLFGNRGFLLIFNRSLAEYFRDGYYEGPYKLKTYSRNGYRESFGKLTPIQNDRNEQRPHNQFYPVQIPTEYLNEKGFIKRQSIPSWVKKAVFFRDHGRCVLCQRDLSGLLSPDHEAHYDHIVPLNKWGTNSPTNIQLLCKDCNLGKSDSPAKTETMYPPWWDY